MSYFSEKKGRTPRSYKIVYNGDFVLAYQLFATMSSGKFKKDKHHQRKLSFIVLVLFLFMFSVLYCSINRTIMYFVEV